MKLHTAIIQKKRCFTFYIYDVSSCRLPKGLPGGGGAGAAPWLLDTARPLFITHDEVIKYINCTNLKVWVVENRRPLHNQLHRPYSLLKFRLNHCGGKWGTHGTEQKCIQDLEGGGCIMGDDHLEHLGVCAGISFRDLFGQQSVHWH